MSRRILVSLDTATVVDTTLDQECITLGRRPYNDIVLDHRSVSGEHAVFRMTSEGTLLEDRNSTNGTFVNGQKLSGQRLLQESDAVEIGHYRIRVYDLAAMPSTWATQDKGEAVETVEPMIDALPLLAEIPVEVSLDKDAELPHAVRTMDSPLSEESIPANMTFRLGRITVISGPASGRAVHLNKPVSAVGKRGTAVATVQRDNDRYLLAYAEGDSAPILNGETIGFTGAVPLHHDDVLELAGALLHFELAEID